MCELLLTQKDILLQLEQMQQLITGLDQNILLIFEDIKELEKEKQQKKDKQKCTEMDFKRWLNSPNFSGQDIPDQRGRLGNNFSLKHHPLIHASVLFR